MICVTSAGLRFNFFICIHNICFQLISKLFKFLHGEKCTSSNMIFSNDFEYREQLGNLIGHLIVFIGAHMWFAWFLMLIEYVVTIEIELGFRSANLIEFCKMETQDESKNDTEVLMLFLIYWKRFLSKIELRELFTKMKRQKSLSDE